MAIEGVGFDSKETVQEFIDKIKSQRGELVPSVSYYQTGNKTSDTTSWGIGETGTFTITLSTAMPDTDYIVVPTLDVVGVSLSVHSKTVNDFKVTVRNDSAETIAQPITLYWQAFKLMTDESRALDEQAIASLQAVVPSSASASNKLVTSHEHLIASREEEAGRLYYKLTDFFTFTTSPDNHIECFICGNNTIAQLEWALIDSTFRLRAWYIGTTSWGFSRDGNDLYISVANYPFKIQRKTILGEDNKAVATKVSSIPSTATEISTSKLVTESDVYILSKQYNGATYTTVEALLTQVAADMLAKGGYGGAVGSVWTGKSYFSGTYGTNGSTAGNARLHFENAQNGYTECSFSFTSSGLGTVNWFNDVTTSTITSGSTAPITSGAVAAVKEMADDAMLNADIARGEIGDITALETTTQDDLVSAINELVHRINAL